MLKPHSFVPTMTFEGFSFGAPHGWYWLVLPLLCTNQYQQCGVTKTGEMGTAPLVMVGMKLDFTNSDQPRGGHILRSHWSWLVQNVFLPTMTNHAVQNIHFQLVLVDHKNVILGFDVTTVPTSTNGAVAIIHPLCWCWLVTRVTVPTSTNGAVSPEWQPHGW